jgi:hypothetical protein
MIKLKIGYKKTVGEEKKQVWHRTATTAYPCYLPVLGEFSRSWSYQTYGCKTIKKYHAYKLKNEFLKIYMI